MNDMDRLVERLRNIEVLFARAGTPGEKVAAEKARERIKERLGQFETLDPPIEFKFRIHDPWSGRLFRALLRRYGIEPYRYHGQRRTTIMAKMPRRFNEELWPEFLELNKTLLEYLEETTNKVIAEAWAVDGGEGAEREGGGKALDE